VIGSGAAPSHHGEILQGMFSVGGRPRNGLVMLPCMLYMARAWFQPDISSLVTVTLDWKKACRAAEVAIAALGHCPENFRGGHLEIMNSAPVGRGLGSSTSDVLAAIRAVGEAFAVEFTVDEIARIAVVAETASDSLMFENSAVLFAQRDSEIIEDFGERLPGMHVPGFTTRAVESIHFERRGAHPAAYVGSVLSRTDNSARPLHSTPCSSARRNSGRVPCPIRRRQPVAEAPRRGWRHAVRPTVSRW
jgi:uncharacterized protein involved in propanediol utilization